MEFALIAYILSWCIPATLLIGVFIGFYLIKTLSPLFKLLLMYLVMALLFDLTNRTIGFIFNGNNLILITIYALAEFGVMAFIYHKIFIEKQRVLFFVLTLAGIAFSTYECFSVNALKPEEFQSYSRVLTAFLIVIFCMMYFFEKLSVGTNPKDHKLIINTGILIFFSLNLVFLLPINFLINESSDLKFYFWIGYILLTNLFYLFLTYVIWKNGKTLKRLQFGSE